MYHFIHLLQKCGLLYNLLPIIKTVPSSLRPSISDKSCETTLSMTPPESPEIPRLGANESNSSKNIIHGDASLAFSNTEIKYIIK